jgi:hypothetical protein
MSGVTNRIECNVFHAKSYLLILGAHSRSVLSDPRQDKGLVGVVTMDILIANYIDEEGSLNRDVEHLIGLLTGIYDYDNTLLAERILLRRISSDEPQYSERAPKRIDKDDEPEYRQICDVIDNSLDGQTLSARISRLEWIGLR